MATPDIDSRLKPLVDALVRVLVREIVVESATKESEPRDEIHGGKDGGVISAA